MRVCKVCAKKGEKVYLRVVRHRLSMILYICPKCNKRVLINRK